jgi:methionine-R-sulfoxide reductase
MGMPQEITNIDYEITPKESKDYPVQLSEEQWRERLSDFEYYVLRQKGTERAFTSDLNNIKEPGIFYSRATGQPLFSTEHKYDSGTGWPSFWRPITLDAIDYYEDNSFFMRRVEVTDSSSGSHLGHVFPDGPDPTGLRYCINGASLIFVAEGEEPPQIVKDYIAEFGDPLAQ